MLKLGIDDIVLLIDHDFDHLQDISIPSDLQNLQDKKEKIKVKLPTKGRILREIRKAVRDTSISSLFISFAGHGTQGRASRANTEESDFKDEYICSLGNTGKFEGTLQSFISDDELMSHINAAASSRDSKFPLAITFVFDCCHSGTIFDLPYSLVRLNNGIEFKTEPRNNLRHNHVTICGWSGCQDNQQSKEDSKTVTMSEGRCSTAFVRAVEMMVLESAIENDVRSEVTNFDLHNIIMRILFSIDRTDDDALSTASKYQVINFSSSRNIGLDVSGKKIVTQVFIPGAKLPSYDYDEIVRVINRSSYSHLQISDRHPTRLNL
jgi:Caspase domain